MTPAQLRHIRTQVLGWPQRRLAEALGLTLAGYQRIETGQVNPERIDNRTDLAVQYLKAQIENDHNGNADQHADGD